MNVVRVERTAGATDMTDAQLRRQIARPDADIVLNQQHMAQPGARFEVKRDYSLTDQHHQMLADNRATFERVSGITSGFMGKQGTANSRLAGADPGGAEQSVARPHHGQLPRRAFADR